MTLPAGTKLGPYEIIAPLGAGGMGEVYRARDSKLRRDVAIKVPIALGPGSGWGCLYGFRGREPFGGEGLLVDPMKTDLDSGQPGSAHQRTMRRRNPSSASGGVSVRFS